MTNADIREKVAMARQYAGRRYAMAKLKAYRLSVQADEAGKLGLWLVASGLHADSAAAFERAIWYRRAHEAREDAWRSRLLSEFDALAEELADNRPESFTVRLAPACIGAPHRLAHAADSL